MIVAVYCAIIRHRVCAWTVNSVKQAVVNDFTPLPLRLVHSETHEVVSKSLNPFSRENAENISLWMCELGRSISTEASQVFSKKCLHSGKRKMSQSWAVMKESCDSLVIC